MSATSLSVIPGRLTQKSGMFILFLFVSFPPCITSHTISLSLISFTFNSIVPSFTRIVLPTLISLYSVLYVIDTFVLSPNSSLFINVNSFVLR